MESNIYKKLFELKQKEIILKKDTQAFWYKYATLKQIQELLSPVLKDLKLIVIHSIRQNQVVTQIRDIEWDTYVESCIDIWEVETKRQENFVDAKGKDIQTNDFNTKDPQWVGSIISYHRRYNLLALLDLEQEDDDWKGWSNRAKTKDYVASDKKWYNDFDKHKDTMIDKIQDGKTTPEWIIKDLESKWYSLSKKTKEDINLLK